MRPLFPILVTFAFLLIPTAAALPLSDDSTQTPGDPTPNAPNAVDAAYDVRLRSALDGFDVEVRLAVHEIEVAAGRSLPAAAIRALPSKEIFEEAVRQQVGRELEAAFAGADVRVGTFEFDYSAPATGQDPYRPAVVVLAVADVRFTASYLGMATLGQADAAEAARALFFSGGSYGIDQGVRVEAGMAVRLTMHVPEPLEVQRSQVGAQSVTVAWDNWANSTARTMPLRLTIKLADGQVPENVLRGPLIDVRFLASDETSKAKQMVPFSRGDFTGQLELRIEVPSLETRFFEQGPTPAGVDMDQVSADMLRVAFDAGLVAPADVEGFLEGLIVRNLQQAFGNETAVAFDRAAFAASVKETVGGADGRSVAPLVVVATSTVPVTVKEEWVSSNMARGLGMLVPTRESFPMTNGGSWTLVYTLVYPHSLKVQGTDTAGVLENLEVDGRDAIRVSLAPGQSTTVTVTGKATMDPLVLGIQGAQAAILMIGIALGVRVGRRRGWFRRGDARAGAGA